MKQDDQLLFREEQRFRQPWVWACVFVPMILTAAGILWQFWSGRPPGSGPLPTASLVRIELALAAVAVWVYQMRLVTEVRAAELSLHFRWLWRRRRIPVAEIRRHNVVAYNPVREYGGWGIRYGAAGDMAYNVSGDRGVRLELTNGDHLLVGSQRPEELARALDVALRVAAPPPPAHPHGWSGD